MPFTAPHAIEREGQDAWGPMTAHTTEISAASGPSFSVPDGIRTRGRGGPRHTLFEESRVNPGALRVYRGVLASPACRPESPPVLETFWRRKQGRTVLQGSSWKAPCRVCPGGMWQSKATKQLAELFALSLALIWDG